MEVPLKNSQLKNRQSREAESQICWKAFRGREKMIKGEEGLAERGGMKRASRQGLAQG